MRYNEDKWLENKLSKKGTIIAVVMFSLLSLFIFIFAFSYNPKNRPVIFAVLFASIPLIILIIGLAYWQVAPVKVRLSNNGIHYIDGYKREHNIPWEKVISVKSIGPLNPNEYRLIYYRRKGKKDWRPLCESIAKKVQSRIKL
jgi:hypothetical protein